MKRTAFFLISVLLLVLFFSLMTASGCHITPSPSPTPTLPSPTVTTTEEPIEIVAAVGPLPDSYEDGKPVYNPGGPIIELTVKNVSDEPVIFLEATLEAESVSGNPFLFSFFEINSSSPLLPGESISTRSILIGGGFGDTVPYPLTIKGMVEGNVAFFYTKQVLITSPTG